MTKEKKQRFKRREQETFEALARFDIKKLLEIEKKYIDLNPYPEDAEKWRELYTYIYDNGLTENYKKNRNYRLDLVD